MQRKHVLSREAWGFLRELERDEVAFDKCSREWVLQGVESRKGVDARGTCNRG